MRLENLTVEHQVCPIGIDCKNPRFGWVIVSEDINVMQSAYQINVSTEGQTIVDTKRVLSHESIEIEIPGLHVLPKTKYDLQVRVWDNKGNHACAKTMFETGFLDEEWQSHWVEPDQVPIKPGIKLDDIIDNLEDLGAIATADPDRTLNGFQPANYIRIPFEAKKSIKKARVYMSAHGIYRLEVNGLCPDNRVFAPENSTYEHVLMYQTYDVTPLLDLGKNIFGVILADGWWCGRVGINGESCQYGDKKGLLFQSEIVYEDDTTEIITADEAVSSAGPIIYSDIFVGEKYDATKEIDGWSTPGYVDAEWLPVNQAIYDMNNVCGQYGEPVRPIQIFKPKEILCSQKGEVIIDVGQVLAGQIELTVNCEAGIEIRLSHTEVLDRDGNYYNNIIGENKDQRDCYITKKGQQTYRPYFTYHGFRYVKVEGWPGTPTVDNFTVYALSSEMMNIGTFITSDSRINRLQKNIWWGQVSNTLSIPTDCPQRERAGWTGDLMVFAPTMLFNRNGNAFLTRWMQFLRADQLSDGEVPVVVPYLDAYKVVKKLFNTETSCGWGDAVIVVPLAMYKAYGDKRIIIENYGAMKKWMNYVQSRVENNHPNGYESWDVERQERSRYLWNTDFHFGDWLVPSMVLGNEDSSAMAETAYKTKDVVAPAYYAFSAKKMSEIAAILNLEEDKRYYDKLYKKIRYAFIEEYVKGDGTIDNDLQGLYVIALYNGLVPGELRSSMVSRLRQLIHDNNGCLDTGFLSILFLMDVLCENNSRDLAYKLLFQTNCPSWLYEVEHGATTMWESWGAVGEDGSVSTYSYNHYAFGCVGDWLYREIGGIQGLEPGYKKIRIAPSLDCGLKSVKSSLYSPYGRIAVDWEYIDMSQVSINIEIPVNTTAEISLQGMETIEIGSGRYSYEVSIEESCIFQFQ